MAKKTAIENTKIKAAREHLDEQTRKLGELLAQAIVAALAAALPEGWILRWHHANDCYNDEDYFFDVDWSYLISEREPRRGEMLEEAKPEILDEPTNTHGRSYGYRRVKQHASDAVYAWHLDDACKLRTKKSIAAAHPEESEAGCVYTDPREWYGNAAAACGLTKKAVQDVHALLKGIDESDLRCAFGDSAIVTVWADGSHEVG